MRRSHRPKRVIPHGPSQPTNSPPSSPTLAASATDEEQLEGSFLLVSGEEDEVSSTVGSSLLDSVIGDLLSDSSEEPAGREGWDESTDGGELEHHTISSIVGNSYIDAEATATHLDSSMGTLQNSTSSSQIRLIMPALEASGITADSNTPSGSLTSLLNIPSIQRPLPPAAFTQRRRGSSPSGRGVEASWLEASSKLWNISPEMEHMLNEAGEYKLLASTENVVLEKKLRKDELMVGAEKEEKLELKFTEKQPSRAQVAQQELRRALVRADLIGRNGKTKKWSVFIALASVLSVALFRPFGPAKSLPLIDLPVEHSPNAPEMRATSAPPTVDKAFSLWDHLPVSHSTATTATVDIASTVPVPTQVVPDLQIVKQALSTFSTSPEKAAAAASATTLGGSVKGIEEAPTHPRRKRREAMTSTSCCSLSIRDSQVSLTTLTTALSTTDRSWSKTLRHKIMRVPTKTPVVIVTVPIPSCPCSLSQHVRSEVVARFVTALGSATNYAASVTRYLDHIFAPALAEFWTDMAELVALARAITETTSTISELVIHRAARGFSVSRHAFEAATSRLREYLPILTLKSNTSTISDEQSIVNDAIEIVRANIDSLSEYIEGQAFALSDYVEEHSSIMQDQGMESLKQAKRGLDKLIVEARKTTGDVEEEKKTSTDVGKEGPMPFMQMHKHVDRPPTSRSSRLHRRHHLSKRNERRIKRSSFPPPETPSRGRRFLDMVHHGVVAFVL